ncbi:Uncharacterised protein [Serratia quinivorans]|uniref:CopG family transcriptional regulator n=1 Tax=Serratia quinivorans TaxID=137545 RepID=UPI00217BE227|nr:CopG family transcriptional regulator [Serratia quinivorans]CAI1780652.1 Uncharacterised protein [Serratia quinivorans]
MSVMSVRLSEDLSEQLEALAAWQITETQQAIIEAEKRDFVPDDEMQARFKRMRVINHDEN